MNIKIQHVTIAAALALVIFTAGWFYNSNRPSQEAVVNGAVPNERDLFVGWDTLIIYDEPTKQITLQGFGNVYAFANGQYGDLYRKKVEEDVNWAICYINTNAATDFIIFIWED